MIHGFVCWSSGSSTTSRDTTSGPSLSQLGTQKACGVGNSLLACASWFVADAVAGKRLAHPALETCNFLARLGHDGVVRIGTG